MNTNTEKVEWEFTYTIATSAGLEVLRFRELATPEEMCAKVRAHLASGDRAVAAFEIGGDRKVMKALRSDDVNVRNCDEL